jgi:hypothetical protein
MAASPGPDRFDMRQSEETWIAFLRLAKWIVGLSVVTVVLMALFLTGSHPPP